MEKSPHIVINMQQKALSRLIAVRGLFFLGVVLHGAGLSRGFWRVATTLCLT